MFGGIFWGTIITALGISIIVEAIFGISIPVFKVLIGCWLIYWGLTFIIGKDCFKTECKTNFSQYDYNVKDENKNFRAYKVLFSQRVIDLRELNIEDSSIPVIIKIDSVFSNTVVKINPLIKTKIKVSSAFSSVELPDKTYVYFGSYCYNNAHDFADQSQEGRIKPQLKIKLNSVFSKVVIEDK